MSKYRLDRSKARTAYDAARYTAKYDKAGVLEQMRMIYPTRPSKASSAYCVEVPVHFISPLPNSPLSQEASVLYIFVAIDRGHPQVQPCSALHAVSPEANDDGHDTCPSVHRNGKKIRGGSLVAELVDDCRGEQREREQGPIAT